MMFKKILFLLCIMVLQVKAQPNDNLSNLTVVVTSCDKYSGLWPSFFAQLFNTWPELKKEHSHVPILLISNKASYNDPRIVHVHAEKDISWSDNMLEALKRVKTDYVLILLEDYFLTSFDGKRFKEIYSYMRSHANISYIQISQPGGVSLGAPFKDIKGVNYKGRHDPYRTSLQACLWKKEDLKHILKSGESAWDFEIPGSVRSEGLKGDFLLVTNDFPLNYLNIVQEGYIYPGTVVEAKKRGIDLNGTLPFAKDHKIYIWFSKKVPKYFYWEIYSPFKKFVKSLLN